MRKGYVVRIMETLMLIILACSSIACIAFGGELSPERLEKANEEDRLWSEWMDKYFKSVLYVGMPVDEFVKLFTKDNTWTDPERPYIISHDDNRYITVGRKGIKHRVTFKDGLLAELEQYTWDVLPLVPIPIAHYADFSFLLKGHKIKVAEGLYQGMSEDEFLKNFSNKIIQKFKNCYVILSKDGHKYGFEFTDGILTHSWRCD